MSVPLPTTVLIAPAASPARPMATTSPKSIAASYAEGRPSARGRARTGPDEVAGHGMDADTAGVRAAGLEPVRTMSPVTAWMPTPECARPGSNRRPSPCKGDALPLSYARAATLAAKRAGPAARDDGAHGADGQGRGGHRRGVGHRAGARLAAWPRRARAGSSSPTSTRAGAQAVARDIGARALARRLRRRRRAAGRRPRRARRGRLRPGRPLLRQRRRRRRHRPRRPRRTSGSWRSASTSARTCYAAKALLPGWLERGEGYFLATASAAGLLTQIGSAPVRGDQARRGRVRRVAVGDLRRSRRARELPVPDGRAHGDDRRSPTTRPTTCAWPPASSPRPGTCSSPSRSPTSSSRGCGPSASSILPHPEVLTFFQRKADDYDRWLAGMRRLQARLAAPS